MSITRVLVANRGEIARRVFATCRRLGLGTVAVYTDPDAAAPHVAEADARVRLPRTNDYLNAEAIIAAARVTGVANESPPPLPGTGTPTGRPAGSRHPRSLVASSHHAWLPIQAHPAPARRSRLASSAAETIPSRPGKPIRHEPPSPGSAIA